MTTDLQAGRAAPRPSPQATERVDDDALPPSLVLAFAPLHKRAFGIATGVASGLVFFLLTAVYLLRAHAERVPLHLLAEYFYGYTVSWAGAFVGLLWGLAVGFVAGWFIAFCRNLALAISVFITRTRGELNETRDFLDHV
jgi:hypothetical protein